MKIGIFLHCWQPRRPIHLHLLFEIPSLKNPVRQTGIFCLFRIKSLLPVWPAKIEFEIDKKSSFVVIILQKDNLFLIFRLQEKYHVSLINQMSGCRLIGQMLSYTWPFQSQNQQRSKTIWSLVYNTTHWHYSNQQFQQSALTPFVTNTFFMTRWLEASFEKNTYILSSQCCQ